MYKLAKLIVYLPPNMYVPYLSVYTCFGPPYNSSLWA